MEKKGMFLENRHISLLLSFFILASFFVFISGYFFGKKKAVEKFYSKVDQESLADHVYYSVCSNYGNCDSDDQDQESTEDTSEQKVTDDLLGRTADSQAPDSQAAGSQAAGSQAADSRAAGSQAAGSQASDAGKNYEQEDFSEDKGNIKTNILQASSLCINKDEEKEEKSVSKRLKSGKIKDKEDSHDGHYREQYYAELIGFGSKTAADTFCDKLRKDGITVYIKKRRSRTSRGRNIDWYQAVTGRFDNKSDLVAFVDIIKDKENLKGVKIVHS